MAAILALLLGAAIAPGVRAELPVRPRLEDRLRLIQAHPRPPARLDPRPVPASGQDDVDVTNYDITLVPSVWERRISGSVVITFRTAPGVASASELVLDLEENMTMTAFAVSRRSAPGRVVPYTREGHVLRIDLAGSGGAVTPGQSEAVTIKYSGFPRQDLGGGLIFSTFGRFPTHVPSMFSLSQPYLARTWWPCKDRPDDKATVTMRVDAPSQWEVVGNGSFVSIAPSGRDGNVVTSWRERIPIPTYLVAVALSDYETCEAEYVSPLDSGVTMPLTHWAWPSRVGDACDRWSATPEILATFAESFGEYPFVSEKYDHVAISPLPRTNPYVAMENATCSFFGSGWLSLSHDSLIAHELAHHWWGNSVTPRDFRSLWLNEGFATWAEALWWESRYGLSEYRGYMRDLDPLRSTGEFVGPVHDPIDADGDGWPDGDASGAELTVYFKGAWVLHMLRWVIGQQDDGASTIRMDHLLTAWGEARKQGVATTDDFTAFADVVATDEFGLRDGLGWFFDQWLHRSDRPCYRVGWTTMPGMDGGWDLQLAVDQARWGLDEDRGVMTCADDLPEAYRMPVAVRVELEGGSRLMLKVDNREPSQAWTFPLPARPVAVTWDPDGWILKAVQDVDVDADGDSWADPFDSCPHVPNPDQLDEDRDGVGDACQPGLDFDGDGRLNEEDCAPADPGAWTDNDLLEPLDMAVGKSANGLVVWHAEVRPHSAGERAHVVDVAQGRLERLRANDSFREAACVETGRTGMGEFVIPWAQLPGDRYVVLMPWNGCGPVAPDGRLDDPCR